MFKSIRSKLLTLIFTIVLLIVVINAFFTIPPTIDLYKKNIEEKLFTATNIVNFQSEAIFDFGSSDVGEKVLQNYSRIPEVDYAIMYDEFKEPFAIYTVDSLEVHSLNLFQENFDNKDLSYRENAIYLRSFVLSESDTVGYIFVKANQNQLSEALNDYLFRNLVFIIVLLSIIYVVTMKLQSIITTPITELTDRVQEISETKNYSIRVNIKNDDEVGVLCKDFNKMIDRIETYKKEILDMNAHLEDKVHERTLELERTLEKVEHAKSEAEHANQMKSRFIANISHEIRTPLNAILGYTDIILSEKSIDLKTLERAQIMKSSGEYLLTLVNNILEISKLQSEQSELKTFPCNFPELIKDVHNMFKESCSRKGLHFSIQFDENLRKILKLDSHKLKQCLVNLVSNAIKFTDSGVVELILEKRDSKIFISVSDTGRGIAPDKISSILEPFTQVSEKNINTEGGTGLGLSICNEFIKLMSGNLQIESKLGAGSTFSFEIGYLEDGEVDVETLFQEEKIDDKNINYMEVKKYLSIEMLNTWRDLINIGDFDAIKSELSNIGDENKSISDFKQQCLLLLDNYDDTQFLTLIDNATI